MAVCTWLVSGIVLLFSEVLSKLCCVPLQVTGSDLMSSLRTVEAGNILATSSTLRVGGMLIPPLQLWVLLLTVAYTVS